MMQTVMPRFSSPWISDSEHGYCNEFEIYTGKSGDHVNAKLGLTTRVALNLIKKIEKFW
jgi:hypothetical protein